MKIKKLTVAVSAALVVAYLPAHAEDEGLGGAPEVKLRGFGTIGVVRNTNSNADVMDNLSQPRGAGYSHKWDFGVDSKLAVQADVKFNNMLSASWQVMSQRQSDDTYRPHTEMGFAKLQATPDISIRLGRIPAPLFMVSEYRKVGYVNPWVRQPNEVYFQVPYNSVDGGDISYQFNKGDFTGNVQVATGSMTPVGIPSEGYVNTLKGYQGATFNFIGEYGPVTFRAGYSRTKNQYDGEKLNSLYGGLARLASNGNGPGGMADMVYANAYASTYGSIFTPPDPSLASIDPAKYTKLLQLQGGLQQVQSQLPNMEFASVVEYVRTGSFDDQNLKTLQAGLNGAIQSAASAALVSKKAYANAVQSGATTLQDANLKGKADELYDQYASNKSRGEFTGIGIIIDPGTWLLQSEYTIRKVDSFLADTTGWYLTGGYRFGKVMPFVSFSRLRVDSRIGADDLVDTNGLAALTTAAQQCITDPTNQALIGPGRLTANDLAKLCKAPLAVVNSISTGVNKTVEGTSYGQKNVSLGVRWDFLKNAALKFQWDRIDTSDYPRGTMQNYVHTNSKGETVLQALGTDVVDPATGEKLTTSFDKAKPVNVFSLAVDFVF